MSTPDDQENSEPVAEELLSHDSYEALLKKLNETEQKLNDQADHMLRMRADTENEKRRLRGDIDNTRKFAIKDFAAELLPIIDSLELSTNNVPNDHSEAAEHILEGAKLTLKMFYAAMEKFGVKQVNPLSKQFNPEFEQAISMQFEPSVTPGTVISVLQKGYTLNDRVIRPALVVVAKGEE
jgi:molecular chaperone GrpE